MWNQNTLGKKQKQEIKKPEYRHARREKAGMEMPWLSKKGHRADALALRGRRKTR